MKMRDPDPFEGFLSYQDRLAVHWQVLQNAPAEMEMLHANDSNESLLKVSGLFGEHVADTEEFADLVPEFARLDLKLNLVLEFLGMLLTQTSQLPGKRLVSLSPRGVAIAGENGEEFPDSGSTVVLDLYIQPNLPKPLKIFGEVVDTRYADAAHIDEPCFVVRFSGINQVVEEWLEKFVFRHHRRLVAQQRKLPENGEE